jgi:ABC-type branched-subunit amino acid transport system substrate-binding protein
MMVLVGACSSNAGSTGSASTAGSKSSLSGNPIKLMTILTDDTAASSPKPEAGGGAMAAAMAINAAGGVDGRPIQIVTCNDQYDPSIASACARQAVSEHVLAVVGSVTDWGSVVDPILQQGGVPMIGNLPDEAADYSTPVSFPFTSGAAFGYQGDPFLLKTTGATKIGIAAFNDSNSISVASTVEKAIVASGAQYAGQVELSHTATDYTPFVATLQAKGATGIVCITSGQAAAGLVLAASQLGYKATFASVGAYVASVLPTLGSNGDNMYLTEVLPPPNAASASMFPAIRTFEANMAAANKAGVAATSPSLYDTNSLNAWLAVKVTAELMAKVQGTLSATSLLQEVRSATDVSLFGLLPAWTPSKGAPAPYQQLSSPLVYFARGDNGKEVLVTSKPFDVLAALGK